MDAAAAFPARREAAVSESSRLDRSRRPMASRPRRGRMVAGDGGERDGPADEYCHSALEDAGHSVTARKRVSQGDAGRAIKLTNACSI